MWGFLFYGINYDVIPTNREVSPAHRNAMYADLSLVKTLF